MCCLLFLLLLLCVCRLSCPLDVSFALFSHRSLFHRYHCHYCSIGSLDRLFATAMRLDENKIQIMASSMLQSEFTKPWHIVSNDRMQHHASTIHKNINFAMIANGPLFQIERNESEKNWSDRVEMNKIYGRLNQMPLSMHTMRIRSERVGTNTPAITFLPCLMNKHCAIRASPVHK